jgi:outer membrane protein TolC
MTAALLVIVALAAQMQDAEKPAHAGDTSSRDLTLAEAIELAVHTNLEVEISRLDESSADAQLKAARGFTDLNFKFQPSYVEKSTPAPSLLEASNGKLDEHDQTGNFYLHQQTPWDGAAFDVAFENSRVSSENPFLGINPFYLSQLSFTYTQPLWRNRKLDSNRATILVRSKQADLSRNDVELRLLDIVDRVQQTYWDLSAARQNEKVAGESVELAQAQLTRDQNRVKAGSLAQAELAAAQAELARRNDIWYTSARIVTEQENLLKQLLAGSRDAAIWQQELVPADQQAVSNAETVAIPDLVNQALKLRPELKSIAIHRQITGIEKRQNENLLKPQVNLVGNYALSGLGGKLNTAPDPITQSTQPLISQLNAILGPLGEPSVTAPTLGQLPGTVIGGYGTDLSNLFSGRYQSAQAGLQIDFTFRNRAAKAAIEESVIAEHREKLEQAREEQAIQSEIRDSIEAMAIARQRRAAAESGERAAKEKLESETRLFETGESTNFLTLTRQNEYSEARRRLLIAILEWNKAVCRLQRSTGTTLSENHVALR